MWWQSWHRSFSPTSQLTAGLTATGARASQTQALHSSGPFWQQPGVISEAQPETAPTAWLQEKGDYMQSRLKTNLFIAQGTSSELSDEISPSLHETSGFISSSSKDGASFPCVPKMHWEKTTWNILTSLLSYFSWKMKKQCNLGKTNHTKRNESILVCYQ